MPGMLVKSLRAVVSHDQLGKTPLRRVDSTFCVVSGHIEGSVEAHYDLVGLTVGSEV